MFDEFNTNKDDSVSLEEFVKGHENKFSSIDANGDKAVSVDEMTKFMATMMKGGKCGEGKCGEGKCGDGMKKEAKMKCGAGKCGDSMKEEVKKEVKK